MIKTELDYNPYLNETKIKFNGNEPRINSLVEKYMKSKLQSWIKYVPKIFHDEMNGYDFDFMFSGTELEFEELKNSFSNANVTDEEVRLFHSNKLESRKQKVERIEDLLQWFNENRNNRFDYEGFSQENHELIKSSYRYIILHAELQNVPKLVENDIEIECILDINELNDTDLKDTPILFYVNSSVQSLLQKEIKLLLSRNDVKKDQLFFYIDKSLNLTIVERTINDLGVSNPQIVKIIDDDLVLKYFNVYPITKYISDMIKILNKVHKDIDICLVEESKKVAISNKNIHEKIDKLDSSMNLLKSSINKFEDKDQLFLSDKYQVLINNFEKKLSKWRSRKVKTTSNYDAQEGASELTFNIKEWLNGFKKDLELLEETIRVDIYNKHNNWYVMGDHKVNYHTKVFLERDNDPLFIKENVFEDLMKLKHEEFVIPDKGLIAQIFGTTDVNEEPVLQTTWLMSEWKDYVRNITNPIIASSVMKSIDRITNYTNALDSDYLNVLNEMLNDEIKAKEDLINQLSSEEKQLEIDNIWLTNFKEQLGKIERE